MDTTRLIKTVRISFIGLLASSFAMADEDATAKPQINPQPGKAETEARCLICHGSTQMGQQRLAPPMVMVKRHYQALSQQEFEKVVMAWVKKPDAEKSTSGIHTTQHRVEADADTLCQDM